MQPTAATLETPSGMACPLTDGQAACASGCGAAVGLRGETRIRPAGESDLPVLVRMIRELAEFEELTEEVRSDEVSLRNALFGDRPAAEALIAEQDGEPAGYAVLYTTFSTFVGKPGLWLEDVFVRPGNREAGLGRALIEAVARIGAERGCERYEWSALRWNENALEFYAGLGTKVMSDWVLLRTTAQDLGRLAQSLEEPTP